MKRTPVNNYLKRLPKFSDQEFVKKGSGSSFTMGTREKNGNIIIPLRAKRAGR
jgi:hypothetical protein